MSKIRKSKCFVFHWNKGTWLKVFRWFIRKYILIRWYIYKDKKKKKHMAGLAQHQMEGLFFVVPLFNFSLHLFSFWDQTSWSDTFVVTGVLCRSNFKVLYTFVFRKRTGKRCRYFNFFEFTEWKIWSFLCMWSNLGQATAFFAKGSEFFSKLERLEFSLEMQKVISYNCNVNFILNSNIAEENV